MATRSRWARRLPWWSVVLVAVLLLPVACSPGGGGGGITPPPEAPEVTQTLPVDGATNVAVGTILRITFSKAMDAGTTEAAFGVAPAVTCTFTWTVDQRAMTCTPTTDLAPDTTYTVTVAASAESDDGVPLGTAEAFDFKTASAVPPGQVCVFGTSTFGDCRLGP